MNTETFAPLLLELLAKSALILAAAASIDRAWLRASAAQRHLVWCAALSTLLVLPLTRGFEPRWTVPLQRVAVELPPPALPNLAPIEPRPISSVNAAPRPATPRWHWPDWKHAGLWVWFVGAGVLLAARLLGSVRLVWLRKTTLPLDDQRTEHFASEIFRELRIRRRVDLRLSPVGCVPLTWGSLRPVLTLPAAALGWKDGALAAALRHEAGHIARGDHLTRWLAQLACIFYWPNPLVWIAARALRVAQEQATDDLVLRAGTPPDEYAAQLFDAARTVAERGFFARHAVAMASPSTLERRMLAIVDERRDRRPLSRFAALAGLSMIALTLAISTAAQLQAADRGRAPAAETPGAATAKPEERQVEVQARFIELSTTTKFPVFSLGEGRAAFPFDKIEGVFSDPQFQVLIRAFNHRKGVDLLSCPRVTTKSKQQAVIEIVRDFRSPSEWEKDSAGAWKPKEFESKNVGVTMEVRAEIKPDGSIELRVKPSVVEFHGFVDLDTGKSGDATWELDAGSMPDLTTLRPVGKRLKPIFSERTTETTVVLKNGYTAALSGMKEIAEVEETTTHGRTTTITRRPVNEPSSKNAPNTVTIRRKLLVFVSARIIDPKKEEPTAMPPGSAAEKASKLIIPTIEFRDAGLRECVTLLQQKSRDHSPDGQGVNLGLILPAGDEPKITLSLTNISLLEAVKNVAQLSGVTFATQPDALVLGTAAAANPAPASAALEKAHKIILPKIELREASVIEAVDFLRQKARELDEDKEGVNLILKLGAPAGSPPAGPRPEDARITISLTNLPLSEALRYVAGLANLKVVAEGNALVLVRTDEAKPAPVQMPPAAGRIPPAGSAAFDKAVKIIFPKIELREATVVEALDLLRKKARELDEDKQGVNMILKPGPGAEAKITMSLTNIPLSEALRYVADLAGLEVRAEPEALILAPAPPGEAMVTKEWRVAGEDLQGVLGTDQSTGAVVAALTKLGVLFPPKASVNWMRDKERIIMRNTRENVERLDAIIEKATAH